MGQHLAEAATKLVDEASSTGAKVSGCLGPLVWQMEVLQLSKVASKKPKGGTPL